MMDIIAHHDPPQSVKDQLAVACSKMKRCIASIMSGKPAHFWMLSNTLKLHGIVYLKTP